MNYNQLNHRQEATSSGSVSMLDTVKWFNVKHGFSFVDHNNMHEDIFVFWRAIMHDMLRKIS